MANKKNLNLGLKETIKREKKSTIIVDKPKVDDKEKNDSIEVDDDSSYDFDINEIKISTKAKPSDLIKSNDDVKENKDCDCGKDTTNCNCGRKKNRQKENGMMGENLPLIIGVGVGGLVLGMLLSK